MPDRDKVIKGLDHCYFGSSGPCYEKECPYYQNHNCTDELKNDILVLLKEHRKPDCEHAEHDGIGCLGYAGCT